MIRRRLFAGVSAISLVLSLAMAGLWVRSLWTSEAFSVSQKRSMSVHTNLTSYVLTSGRGSLGINFSHVTDPSWKDEIPEGLSFQHEITFDASDEHSWRPLFAETGFWYRRETENEPDSITGQTINYVYIGVPFILPVVLLGLPAGIVFYRCIRRHTKLSKGYCVTCSYNLTGNTSGVCPECGTPVPKEPADKSPRSA